MEIMRTPLKNPAVTWRGYILALGLVIAVTLLKYFFQPEIIPSDAAILYILTVVPVAMYFGLGPSIFAAVLSVLAYNFFFFPPFTGFSPTQIHALPTFVILLVTGLIVSYLASNLGQKTKEAYRLNQQIIESQEKENKVLAMELHDDIAPNLAFLGLELDAINTKYKDMPEEINHRIVTVKEKMDKVQRDIRHLSHTLHPGVLENIGLEAALENLVEEIGSKGRIKVQFNSIGGEKYLSGEVKLGLYRITQEALNNALKHSKATMIEIRLEYSENDTRLVISDNGVGFSPLATRRNRSKRGIGLINMEDRANLIGAKLKIKSEIGSGTTVSVVVIRNR